jgi:hypothetical protein
MRRLLSDKVFDLNFVRVNDHCNGHVYIHAAERDGYTGAWAIGRMWKYVAYKRAKSKQLDRRDCL